MKTASAKAKGRNLQKWVVAQFLKVCPELTKDDIRSTSMGKTGADVELSAAAKKIIPFDIECKNQEAVGPIYKMFEQAVANTDPNRTTLLVIKKNKARPLIVLDAETFISLR